MSKPTVHTLATAAEFAKVEPKVILRWIREGLRATPVGTVGRRGKRDYRIFEAWLVEFLERRSEVAAPTVDEEPEELIVMPDETAVPAVRWDEEEGESPGSSGE